jgi:hypothetical protein
MSTYKQVKGVTVQTRDEDPTVNVGSWSSGDTMNTPRSQSGSSGTQTSGLVFAGDEYPASPRLSDKNEYYNGSSWTELAEVNTARRLISGAGASHTSAIAFAGYTTTDVNNTETWNGSAWTEVNEMQTARAAVGEAGILTGALGMGGIISGPGVSNLVESWDGTNWTEVGELNTARRQIAGLGTYTAAFAVNGGPPAATIVEQWNGSSWTETTENNTGRYAGGACGTVTAGLFFCGNDPVVANTEDWNGTVWTEVNDLSTARKEAAPSVAGTSTVALASGGHTDAAKSGATEEWSFPSGPHLNEGDIFLSGGITLKGFGKPVGTLPTGVWSSANPMNVGGREGGGTGFGSQTAGVAVGGNPSPGPDSACEHYNGTSWSNVEAFPSAGGQGGTTGSQTAGIAMGLNTPNRALCYTYNGVDWSEVAELNTGRGTGVGLGTQTDALLVGGGPAPGGTYIANVEKFDGSSWSEVGDLNDSRRQGSGGGGTAAGFYVAGTGGSPSTNPNQMETWNGTSWTEANELNTGRGYLTGGGEATLGITFGGGPASPGTYTNTETWNGTSWTEQSDMASRSETSFGTFPGAGVGTYRAGGQLNGSLSTGTEEWNVDAALSTVTVS